MAIDTQTKRRSVNGYSQLIIAPVADGAISAADREHVAGLYAGIGVTPPALPYAGDAYRYDDASGTSTIVGGTVQADPNQSSPIGTIVGGTVQPDPNQSSPTGTTSGGTILAPDHIYD